MTSNITREAILDLLREVARDAIDNHEIPTSYAPVNFDGIADRIVVLTTPVPDPNGDAVAWRQQVADGLGYMIPETGQIADAQTIVDAAKSWERDSRDMFELTQVEAFPPPF